MKKVFTKKNYRAAAIVTASVLTISAASAQQKKVSTQAHNGAVTSIVSVSEENFYSTGNDGIITKWADDGVGLSYQASDLAVQKIAINPSNSDIAVSETDGNNIFKIEVIDWESQTKKYTKQFIQPVKSISYSPKGTFLFITVDEAYGTYIFDAATGKLIKQLMDLPQKASLVKGGKSEKTAVIYCDEGKLVYYNLTNFKKVAKAEFTTTAGLTQPMTFGGDKYLAGVKGNTIYIEDTMSGKQLAALSATNPTIIQSSNTDENGLYFLVSTSSGRTVRYVSCNDLAAKIKDDSTVITSAAVKTFTGIDAKDALSCIAKNSGNILFGSKKGLIYSMKAENSASADNVAPMTHSMYAHISDITSIQEKFYLLTSDGVYESSYDEKKISQMATNPSVHTNITAYNDDNAVLWSKGSSKALQLVNLKGSKEPPKQLLVPGDIVKSVRVLGDTMIYVTGTQKCKVVVFNISTGKSRIIYSGYTIEDAVLVNQNYAYVAKSKSGANDSPIISVNVNTSETVPLKIQGYYAYNLSYENSELFGITLKNESDSVISEVINYSLADKTSRTVYRFNQSDEKAFTSLQNGNLYTNLGKNQLYSRNLSTSLDKVYRRTASIPVRITISGDRLILLNKDGGISWYNPASQTSLADWYLTVNNEWIEF